MRPDKVGTCHWDTDLGISYAGVRAQKVRVINRKQRPEQSGIKKRGKKTQLCVLCDCVATLRWAGGVVLHHRFLGVYE